uniref:WD repeat-containing protein 75 n=1 Tax=Parasteatoda tepidariorum TaxID=114398 RepID=A0A2L2Y659_PARTP
MEDWTVKVRSGSSLVSVKPIFSYDSKCLIVASGPNIKVYNVQSCECLHILRYHQANIVGLQEYKDNCLQFLSCSQDGIVVRWEIVEGTLLKVYKLKSQLEVVSFYAPFNTLTWFVNRRIPDPDRYRLYCYKMVNNNQFKLDILLSSALPSENAIAFGSQGNFVASIYENSLCITKLGTKEPERCRHLTGKVKLTCVVSHPKDDVVATGDDLGRVIVWSNIFSSKKVIRSIYHWHSLPVADLVFSTEGSYIYSGGGESCLVKWNLFSEEKWVLPRLGTPIRWVKDSPDSSHVVVCLEENTLRLIDPQRNIVGVIQGLTRGSFRGDPRQSVLSTGLLYDPQSKSIVLNGKAGHLQFYNVFEDKHMYELDISGRNFISNEREHLNYNVDISKAAVDERGQWLATVEYWSNGEVNPMIDLKFWEFNLTKQIFIMNTRVELPHNKEINCVIFRPYDASDTTPIVITTSEDCHFKTWALIDDTSFEGKQSWACILKSHYREHLPAGDACFSEDGSVLAIAVKNIATLWTDNGTQLEAALFQENNERPIKQLKFGKYSCKHLLVCHDGFSLYVWNVLSLSIAFTIHVAVQTIAVDITSDLMAVFVKDDDDGYQNLYLFKPDSPNPLFVKKNVSEKPVLSSLFVPKKMKNGTNEIKRSSLENSQLYFFNEDQCLLTMTDNHDDDFDSNLEKIKMKRTLPMTPFGFLQAQQKASGVKEIEQVPLVIQTTDSAKDSMDYPNPTYMDHFAICSKVLRSYLRPKPVEKSETNSTSGTITKECTGAKEDLRNRMESMETVFKQKLENFSNHITDFTFLRDSVHFTTS